MIAKLFSSQEVNSTVVLTLSAMVVALVAKADGPLSAERLLARALPDPLTQLTPRAAQPSQAPLPTRASRVAT